LPVPQFAEIKKAWQAARPADFAEQEKHVEAQVSALLEKYPKKKQKLAALTEAGKSGLTHCTYLRAHVAGRLAINLDKHRVEGALIYMIASAGLGLWNQIEQNLAFIRQRTGLSTPSTTWGAAWTLFLVGDWARAESLLWKASENDPRNATFLIMLAYAQCQRGKLQAAIMNATKAANLEPHEPEHAKVLVRALIDAGRLTDAATKLEPLNSTTTSDPEILMLAIRLHLMRHEYEAAGDTARRLRECDSNLQWLIWLGGTFERARQDQKAARFYREALDLGHYPEALLGLARIAANEKRVNEAKNYLISALDLEKTVGSNGRDGVELFHPIINQLALLDAPRENCTAWIATFPAGSFPKALAQRAVMIYATSRRAAENHLDVVTAAMQPTQGATASSKLQWREAPKDQQPARPVREGVQFVL
jgi:tetratricopeptide (TPR) repeat protein